MAKPRTLGFGDFKIYVGDGASPETFSAPCGFKQKSLQFSANASGVIVPDCADEEAVAWEEKAVGSLSAQVTGQGVHAQTASDVWRTWMLSGLPRNIRIVFDDTLANGGGYYYGRAILTTLGYATSLGSDANKVQRNVVIDNDGEWQWHNP